MRHRRFPPQPKPEMSAPEEATQIPLVDGTIVVVPDSPHLLSSYILQEQGDWFEEEIKFLRQLVQPGQCVIDIGANYGVYALSLARCVGPTGQVWAFEPASDTARYLASAIAANNTSWVRLEKRALSDHEGTAWLRKPGQSELNSLAPADGPGSSPGEGEAVPLTTLDACMAGFDWGQVDVLKIDAEGEEKRILAGGQRFFRDTSPLVMFEVKAGAELHLDLVEAFEALDYRCFRLVPGLAALVPFALGEAVDPYILNLFAAKADRAAALAAQGWLLDQEEARQLEAAVPEPDSAAGGGWLKALEALPYGQALAPRWSVGSDQPGRAQHGEAIAAWMQAQDRTLPLLRRFGALRRSFTLLNPLCQADGPASRCASLARIAMALGERQRAVEALAQLSASLERQGEASLEEPFLAPHPAYDSIDPQGKPLDWLDSAALEALECFASFSSFFTGAATLPGLMRLSELGMATPAMARRLALVRSRFPQSPPPPAEENASVRPWFDLLALERPLRVLDVGALVLTDAGEPWMGWAREGCAEVIGFEPLQEECAYFNAQAHDLGGRVRCLPVALGDGNEHTLHITNFPMTSSLFPPARDTVDLFPHLGELMEVERMEKLRTCRLDDLEEVRPVDFLKLDVQGAELMVLRHATATLADVAVVQCEVEFLELYEGQPLMGEVDAFLRSQGFTFLRFSSLQGRPFKPLQLEGNSTSPLSQMLWGDAVYVRDFRKRSHWTLRQLRAAAFLLHELYKAFDLVTLLLGELDLREQSDLRSTYLFSVLVSEPSLAVS